jgi:pimeloyl-ACP methyl ester carboxylesterase
MNAQRNVEYAARAPSDGWISLPVLFLHGAYDTVCQTVGSRLADPMPEACQDLTEVVVNSGHWMAQEQPVLVNRALCKFIANRTPELFG